MPDSNPQNTPGTPEPGADSGDTGGTSSGAYDGKTAEQWARSYKGLQSHVNKLNDTVASLTSERDGVVSEYETAKASISDFETAKAELAGQVDGLGTQLSDANASLVEMTAKVERQSLIMSEFPDLASFEAKGLLPTSDDPEVLRETLTSFRDAIGDRVLKGVDETLEGSSVLQDSSNQSEDDLSSDSLYAKLMELAGVPEKQAEYDRIYELYLARQK